MFDNSLREIASDLSNLRKRMQKYIHLHTLFFINSFHCRYELSKAERNKFPYCFKSHKNFKGIVQ